MTQAIGLLIFIFSAWSVDLQGQPLLHSITFQWTDAKNVPNAIGVTYNIYRATGTCAAATATVNQFAVIGTAGQGNLVNPGQPTVFQYTDFGVTIGTYCYEVTAIAPGLTESPRSPTLEATIASTPPPPAFLFAPTDLKLIKAQ